MTISGFQAEIVSVLASNRTARSFFSGSLVLDRYLMRPIGDLDIHCVAEEDYISALYADLDALLRAEIQAVDRRRQDGETEITLKRGDDITAVNWVISGKPRLCAPVTDKALGWRVTVGDAVLEKLTMARLKDRAKHFDDLAMCVNAGICDHDLIIVAASCQSSTMVLDLARGLISEIIQSRKLEKTAIAMLMTASISQLQTYCA